jgi:N utilization substance protein B
VSARRKARKRALDVLYAADIRGVDALSLLQEQSEQTHQDPARYTDNDYAVEIIRGVVEHLETIDARLSAVSTEWPVPRLASIDRGILRIATWEILFRDDIPTAVAVSEAGEIAAEYSTDESRSFVQGVLGGLAKAQNGAQPAEGSQPE